MRKITGRRCERSEYAYAIQKRLARLGFNLEDTGGGCSALVARGPRGIVAVSNEACCAYINAIDFRDKDVIVGVYKGDSWDRGEEPAGSFRTPRSSKQLFRVVSATLRAIGKRRNQ
jgi:hypothetical protein